MKQGSCVSARGSSMFKGPEAERSSSPSPLAHLSRDCFSVLTLPGFPHGGLSPPRESKTPDMEQMLRYGS